MKGVVSPGTGRRYPLTMICTAWRVPRSSVYATAPAPTAAPPPGKRGPKTPTPDAAILAAIREVLRPPDHAMKPACNALHVRFTVLPP
jgi:hypothetical protein